MMARILHDHTLEYPGLLKYRRISVPMLGTAAVLSTGTLLFLVFLQEKKFATLRIRIQKPV